MNSFRSKLVKPKASQNPGASPGTYNPSNPPNPPYGYASIAAAASTSPPTPGRASSGDDEQEWVDQDYDMFVDAPKSSLRPPPRTGHTPIYEDFSKMKLAPKPPLAPGVAPPKLAPPKLAPPKLAPPKTATPMYTPPPTIHTPIYEALSLKPATRPDIFPPRPLSAPKVAPTIVVATDGSVRRKAPPQHRRTKSTEPSTSTAAGSQRGVETAAIVPEVESAAAGHAALMHESVEKRDFDRHQYREGHSHRSENAVAPTRKPVPKRETAESVASLSSRIETASLDTVGSSRRETAEVESGRGSRSETASLGSRSTSQVETMHASPLEARKEPSEMQATHSKPPQPQEGDCDSEGSNDSELDSYLLKFHCNEGAQNWNKKDWPAAEESFNMVLSRYPKGGSAEGVARKFKWAMMLATTQIKLQKWEEALQTLRFTEVRKPPDGGAADDLDSAELHTMIAKALFRQGKGDLQASRVACEKAVKVSRKATKTVTEEYDYGQRRQPNDVAHDAISFMVEVLEASGQKADARAYQSLLAKYPTTWPTVKSATEGAQSPASVGAQVERETEQTTVAPPPVALPDSKPRQVLATATAEWDYKGADSSDLSFSKGDIIYVSEYANDEWWYGTSGKGGSGLFPKSYVKVETVERPKISSVAQPPPTQQILSRGNDPQSLVAPGIVVAVRTVAHPADNELRINAGDVLRILERIGPGSAWWLENVKTGATGYVSQSYLRHASDDEIAALSDIQLPPGQVQATSTEKGVLETPLQPSVQLQTPSLQKGGNQMQIVNGTLSLCYPSGVLINVGVSPADWTYAARMYAKDAIENDNLDRIRILCLAVGTDPRIKDLLGGFMHVACVMGRVSILKEMLNIGLDPNGTSPDRLLLFRKAFCQSKEISSKLLELLLAHGAKINAANPSGESALHVAAALGSLPLVQQLIAAGADVKAKHQPLLLTPLHMATGRPDEFGALSAMYEQKTMALPYKTDFGQVVAELCSHGAYIDARNVEPGSSTDLYRDVWNEGFWSSAPLHMAARSGRVAAAESLLQAGAFVNAMDFYSRKPLYFAIRKKQENMVKLLLRYGADEFVTETVGEKKMTAVGMLRGFDRIRGYTDREADGMIAVISEHALWQKESIDDKTVRPRPASMLRIYKPSS